jgi:hypothetical protein
VCVSSFQISVLTWRSCLTVCGAARSYRAKVYFAALIKDSPTYLVSVLFTYETYNIKIVRIGIPLQRGKPRGLGQTPKRSHQHHDDGHTWNTTCWETAVPRFELLWLKRECPDSTGGLPNCVGSCARRFCSLRLCAVWIG